VINVHTDEASAGHVEHHLGRIAYLALEDKPSEVHVASVVTFGRASPTIAETRRRAITLEALQGRIDLREYPFFRHIWFDDDLSGLEGMPPPFSVQPALSFPGRLNMSQVRTVREILSMAPHRRVVVCHGPPGTGKTTVISAAVTSTMAASSLHSIWIVAHSNVAVKNVAEKLLSEGFDKFKLLLAKEFHYDW
jgi:hypothetical protein